MHHTAATACGAGDSGSRELTRPKSLVLGGLAVEASWGQSLSYLLLPVLGQQQADLSQLLLDHLLVNHVELQAGLWVLRERFVLGVILIVAAVTPPFFFLVTSGKCR